MNWDKESNDRQTLTRSQFKEHVAKIITAIAVPVINAGKAYAVLAEQFGMKGTLDFTPHWGDDTEKWEHPLVTAHNAQCGQRGILNHYFFTLYSKIVDYEGAKWNDNRPWSQGYIEFITGRVGNTYEVGRTFNVINDAPVDPAENPQLNLDMEA